MIEKIPKILKKLNDELQKIGDFQVSNQDRAFEIEEEKLTGRIKALTIKEVKHCKFERLPVLQAVARALAASGFRVFQFEEKFFAILDDNNNIHELNFNDGLPFSYSQFITHIFADGIPSPHFHTFVKIDDNLFIKRQNEIQLMEPVR